VKANLWISALLVLGACTSAAETHNETRPTREREETVVLRAEKAEQLGVETAPVRKRGQRRIVPSSGVAYDQDGDAWIWTALAPDSFGDLDPFAPITFSRRPVTVTDVSGGRAVLLKGPLPGSLVVSAGMENLPTP
jgi:hypothetical protein